MAWRRPGNKPLSGPMMVRLLMHICVTRPQWVNRLKNMKFIKRTNSYLLFWNDFCFEINCTPTIIRIDNISKIGILANFFVIYLLFTHTHTMPYFYPLYFHLWNSILFIFFQFKRWKIWWVDSYTRNNKNYIYVIRVTIPTPCFKQLFTQTTCLWQVTREQKLFTQKSYQHTVDCLETGWGSKACDRWLLIMCWVKRNGNLLWISRK